MKMIGTDLSEITGQVHGYAHRRVEIGPVLRKDLRCHGKSYQQVGNSGHVFQRLKTQNYAFIFLPGSFRFESFKRIKIILYL